MRAHTRSSASIRAMSVLPKVSANKTPLVLFRRGGCDSPPFNQSRVMNPLLEPPPLRGAHIAVLIITVVLDLVGVAAQSDHEHVHGAGGAVRRRRDDVIRIDVQHTLLDPSDLLAPARSAA